MKGEDAKAPPTVRVFVEPNTLEALDRSACDFVSALLKFSHRVLRGDASLPSLEALGLSPLQAEFLRQKVPEHANELMVIGRLDVSTDGQRAVSYEFNGDQPGGLSRVVRQRHGGLPPPGAAVSPEYRTYLDAASKLFRKRTGRSQPETMLLVSRDYADITVEAREIEAYFGRPVLLVDDPAACAFDGTHLVHRDDRGRAQRVDLVFRGPRINIYELVSYEYSAICRAYLADAVVLVNPPHARVAGCKSLYAVLGDRRLQERVGLTVSEAAAVDRLLPPTLFVNALTRQALLADRDRWVLKAPLGGCGRHVHFGADLAPEDWALLLLNAGPGTTVQAFQEPCLLDIETSCPGALRLRVPGSIDPFVTGGAQLQVAGYLVRAVLPACGDPAELRNVKLNLSATYSFLDAEGVRRPRIVALGRLEQP